MQPPPPPPPLPPPHRTHYGACVPFLSLLYSTVPEAALSLSIVHMGTPVAGNMYELLCSATIQTGVQSTPIFSWLDSNGSAIKSGDGIIVGRPTVNSLPLEFTILRGSHSGRLTCTATLYSLVLQAPLTASVNIDIDVQCKLQ